MSSFHCKKCSERRTETGEKQKGVYVNDGALRIMLASGIGAIRKLLDGLCERIARLHKGLLTS